MLDFQERMVMSGSDLAFFTQVEVWADSALVSDSFDAIHTTLVTDEVSMNYLLLFDRLFL